MGAESGPVSKEPPSVLVGFSYCAVQGRCLSPANVAFTLPAVPVRCLTWEGKHEKNRVALFNLDLETVGVCVCVCNGDKKWREVLCECMYLHMLLFRGFLLLFCCFLGAPFMHFTTFQSFMPSFWLKKNNYKILGININNFLDRDLLWRASCWASSVFGWLCSTTYWHNLVLVGQESLFWILGGSVCELRCLLWSALRPRAAFNIRSSYRSL